MTGSGNTANANNPLFKAVGISLAVGSGLFIGTSFVLKKKGLLQANCRYNTTPGEGLQYLKNWTWWAGMTLMVVGEISNFAAYAFTDAILVTPLGALTVVIAAIGSSIFLKERLSFVGKVACALCLLGSSIIVVNAPSQKAVTSIQEMQSFVISPGFLSYGGALILISLFLVIWAAPRYGNKHMLVYISVCSLIGSLSVVATQGLGAAVVAQVQGTPQFNQWFLYVLLGFVICTLLVEIVYLNKALNIFNTSIVTPTYYVYFTSATIASSTVLFRGFGSSNPTVIGTVVLGFLVICGGVILLQLAKAADKVSDAAQLSGDLDDVRAVTDVEKVEEDPGADAIRGTLNIRRFSTVRRKTKSSDAEVDGQTSPIHLSHRATWKWNHQTKKDGHFLNVPVEWGHHPGNLRESTIVEVPPEKSPVERKSSVHFNPNAPATHIYPRKPSLSKEAVDMSRSQSSHNPLSPVDAPDFMSAPPTPRYTTPKRMNLQRQFSFGKTGKKHHRSEEETVGLVKAGQRQGFRDDDRDSDSPRSVSEDSEADSRPRHRKLEEPRRKERPYGMF